MSKVKKKSLILLMLVFTLSFFFMHSSAPNTIAAGEVHEINNFSELMNAAILTKQDGYQNYDFILTNNIAITDEDQNTIASSDYKSLSFGSSDFPYSGTFDGNGYTISNLTAEGDHDNGLFSYTDGATIKNLTIDNSEIRSYFRGGILVGYANNTTIENVTIKNSHQFATAADNVVTLITDGGVRAGALVGDAFNSTIYNCESDNNFVNTNSTSGVAALGGKGLTLGGLVGISNGTTVEYSRVVGGRVSNYYDVVVGAVGGNTLYVGGIVGQMQNSSKVIDSFSTAELYYYCATYVSVGAGNVGHIGGITSKMDGNTNEIYRSHYAGVATSRQYNTLVAAPIIQNNQNISGIADIYDGGAVVSSYFKPSLNPDVNMKVLGNSDSTTAYGPLSDSQYTDKNYWQEQSYDFLGTTRRTSNYNNNHYNKWVMDTNLGIPVHGKSISATLDFPGAGSVSIDKSDLVHNNVTTTYPYNFAVQGFRIEEETTNLTANLNNGYKLVGWYKLPNVAAWELEEDHTYFEDIFANNTSVSTNTDYNNIEFDDNDLYIAYMQAKVTFHDYEGNIIDTSGDNVMNTNNYYDYNTELPDVIPNTKPNSTSATLIGWTTTSNNGEGYSSITSTELSTLKNNNDFYQAGDKIIKALDLYPIYTDLASNIHLIFEGNEQDSSNVVSERTGVGAATVTKNNDDTITLNIVGEDNGNLPDGYRFLGWYNEDDIRVSKDMAYKINTNDIDLTLEHTYTAKFEYRVDYWVRAFVQNNGNSFNTPKIYTSKWMKYNDEFENLPATGYRREYITHWGLNESVNHGTTNNETDAYSGNIIAPLSVYSHNYNDSNGVSNNYQVYADTDFPVSGTIFDEASSGTHAVFRFTPASDRYHLLFWTLERDDNNKHWSYYKNPMDTGTLINSSNYRVRAMITTDIIFHEKDDTPISVTRRYENNVFMDNDTIHTYYYPFYHKEVAVDTTTSDSEVGTISNTVTLQVSPSHSDMVESGYYFLGWISSLDVEPNSDEWNYIYDVANDSYTTSDIRKAQPYLVDEASLLVTETMDLYPVYVKYNIETTTNVESVNTNTVNIPSNPGYFLNENGDGTGTIEVLPNINTHVTDDSDQIFNLTRVTVKINDGEEITINPSVDNRYFYNTEAGPTYIFTAYYEPYIVVYHLDDSNIDTYIKNNGDELGTIPNPEYNINTIGENYLYLGYTKEVPTNGKYHDFTSYTAYENSNISLVSPSIIVTSSLELYPVYIKVSLNINSNIDDYLEDLEVDASNVYEYKRIDDNTMNLKIKLTDLNIYHFEGWYENYQDDNNPGTLITNKSNYELSSSELYSNKTYTAVYREVYVIRYYNVDGTILKTIYPEQNSNRTFVTTTLDSEENVVEVPVDSEVFTKIYNYLDKNEYLSSFNWIKQDGAIVAWDDFKDNIITSNMDLYPVINRVTATDSDNNSIDLVGTNEDDPDIIIATKNDNVLASFNITYNKPSLTFHVEELTYKENECAYNSLPDVTVNLYKNPETETILDTEKTNSSGNALFKFYIDVQITKNRLSSNTNTDIFIFNITNTTTNNIQKVLIKPGETITVKLPYGDYTVTEDNNWAWRYQSLSGNISLNNNSTNHSLTFTNISSNNKWFDSMNYKKNKFN